MQRLIIPRSFSEHFVCSFLPDYISKLLTSDFIKIKKSAAAVYLEKEYGCNISDMKKCFSSVKVDIYKSVYILHFDIEDRLITNKNKLRIREALHILTYGNREIKGTRIIDNAFEYIKTNIRYIYYMYMLKQAAEKRAQNGNKILR